MLPVLFKTFHYLLKLIFCKIKLLSRTIVITVRMSKALEVLTMFINFIHNLSTYIFHIIFKKTDICHYSYVLIIVSCSSSKANPRNSIHFIKPIITQETHLKDCDNQWLYNLYSFRTTVICYIRTSISSIFNSESASVLAVLS